MSEHKEIQNVVLVVCDSLSAMRMSLYGHRRKTTPRIDAFFQQKGEVYSNVRSNASWTFLSFPSLFRSQMPSGITVKELSSNSNSFTKILEASNVSTYGIGYEGERAILQNIRQAFPSEKMFAFPSGVEDKSVYQMYRQALDLLKNKNEEKKIILLHEMGVHMPYDPASKYRTLFGKDVIPDSEVVTKEMISPIQYQQYDNVFSNRVRRLYDQGVREFDDRFSDFLEQIDEDILRKTLVILTADHGETFGSRDNEYNHGTHLCDDLLRVPLCIYDPTSKTGRSIAPFSLLDLAPTILDRLNIGIPSQYEGVPINLSQTNQMERPILAEGRRSSEIAPRENLQHLVTHYSDRFILDPVTQKTVVIGKYKYHIYAVGFAIKEYVYDLEVDPFEMNDLLKQSETLSEKVREFHIRARSLADVRGVVDKFIK